MAFGKLQELVPGRPVTWRGQNLINVVLLLGTVVMLGYLIWDPRAPVVFAVMSGVGLLIGVLMVLPIGGGDMPVVISLLNSYAGLAAAATGFALDNNVLIIVGALDGASGFLLSMIMSKAMNRSFGNIIFGAFGSAPPAALPQASMEGLTLRSTNAEDVAVQLSYARKVIIVPGYGMAVAQAQQAVRELAELVERRGGEVLFAIHPVAGRMPGHMNVLLAEAKVPYDRLVEMEAINDQFQDTDVVIVVGANDVVNPAARDDPRSPIFGMPILDVDRARSVIVLKRGMAPGFAGIENRLFFDPRTAMLFGDAKKSIGALVTEMKGLALAA
jgi:NAD(P) transhydrogenase subunit beta